jgi:carboxylesterase type B
MGNTFCPKGFSIGSSRHVSIGFARTGNPNRPEPPAWTKYNGADCPPMVFNSESAVVNDPIGDQQLAIFQVVL